MKPRIVFIFLILGMFVSACGSSKKSTQSDSPYLTEENSQTEVTVREEKVKVVDQVEETVYRYYVIIGSFRVIENARQYRSELIAEGFSPVILENENGLFRISAGAYNEEKAARTRIANIRARYDQYKDVWLLVRK